MGRSMRVWRAVLGGLAVAAVAFVPRAVAAPAAAASTVGCPTADPGSHPGPYFLTAAVPLPAGVHVVSNLVDVILPAGYCTSGARYPVVYLLHGAGDNYQSWEADTDLKRYLETHGAAYPYIFVMPDGGANTRAGWYSDWLDRAWQYETYHVDVVEAYVNRNFNTRADDMGVAGLSMGGFGALSYAARHPGMFKVAASFSGAVDMLYGAPVTGMMFGKLHTTYGTPTEGVWGSQTTNRATWEAHNPTSLAAKLAGTDVLLASGTGTPGGAQGDALTPGTGFDPGGYLVENAIFQMNLSLVEALTRAHVPYTSNFYPGGYHGWPYWQADLHWALPLMARSLGGPVKG